MIALFQELFEYNHHFNQAFVDEFEKHMDRLPERTYPLFCHVINAHQVWNARITGSQPVGVHDVHTLEKCREMDRENYRQTTLILSKEDMGGEIFYKNSNEKNTAIPSGISCFMLSAILPTIRGRSYRISGSRASLPL